MDRNCGLCGNQSCEEFRNSLKKGIKHETDCPFHAKDRNATIIEDNTDTHGNKFDFVLKAIGSISLITENRKSLKLFSEILSSSFFCSNLYVSSIFSIKSLSSWLDDFIKFSISTCF